MYKPYDFLEFTHVHVSHWNLRSLKCYKTVANRFAYFFSHAYLHRCWTCVMSTTCPNWLSLLIQHSSSWERKRHKSLGSTCIIMHWPRWKHGCWWNSFQVRTHSRDFKKFECLPCFILLGGNATFPNILNNFVHVLMYFYYMLAAMGPQYQKYLWWKRYMTELQIVSIHIARKEQKSCWE